MVPEAEERLRKDTNLDLKLGCPGARNRGKGTATQRDFDSMAMARRSVTLIPSGNADVAPSSTTSLHHMHPHLALALNPAPSYCIRASTAVSSKAYVTYGCRGHRIFTAAFHPPSFQRSLNVSLPVPARCSSLSQQQDRLPILGSFLKVLLRHTKKRPNRILAPILSPTSFKDATLLRLF